MAAVLPHSTQHTYAHLVRATEQLQALFMLGADLPVQVARLIHQLVSLEGGRLIMWLDVCLTIVGQTHEARLDRLAATAHAEITEGLLVHVGERGELRALPPGLLVYVRQVASQNRPWCEGRTALGAAVHTHVVKLVPVDLDAFQAVNVTTGDGDRVSQGVHTQRTKGFWW